MAACPPLFIFFVPNIITIRDLPKLLLQRAISQMIEKWVE